MIRPFLAAALLLLAAKAHAADTRPPIVVGQLTLQPCNVGYNAYCGSITRPLDPADPAKRMLTIGFEWFPRRDQSTPPIGTIAAQEGGPGYSTTGSRDGYVRLFDALRDHRDILLMDKRGTGTSGALDCPSLQIPGSATPADYAACGALLGPNAYYYASRFAADDLAALLTQLGRKQIDYYGDSYGTYFGQIFARRHPNQVRTLILDSAYPAGGPAATPWFATEYNTTPRALRTVCERSPACAALPGDPVTRMDALVAAVRANPVTGLAPNSSGGLANVTVNPTNLFMLFDFAGNSPIVWREWDAADRAWLAGDTLPLLRLMAESLDGNGLGNYGSFEFSNALATAVICADYPQLFDMRAPPALRRLQYQHALAGQRRADPTLYAPFTLDEAIGAPFQPLEIGVCLNWPVPPADAQPDHPAGPAPLLPTLVMNGEIDTITSVKEGAYVSAYFASPNYTIVANAIHETAIGDGGEWPTPYGGDLALCGGPIVLAFIVNGGPGNTSCAHQVRPIRTPAAFVLEAADATLPQALPGNRATPLQLRTASAAAETVGDIIARYYQQGTRDGRGLRGGRFVFNETQTGYKFVLDSVKWTNDLAVSGTIDWNQITDIITATITLSGAATGTLTIAWNDRQTDAIARITGTIDATPIAAARIAP
jgi:pimeloyl-ACP methyl ester carboxylesterase